MVRTDSLTSVFCHTCTLPPPLHTPTLDLKVVRPEQARRRRLHQREVVVGAAASAHLPPLDARVLAWRGAWRSGRGCRRWERRCNARRTISRK